MTNWGRNLTMGIVSLLLVACAGERPQNLGAREGVLAACPSSPNCVSSQARDERQRIAPLAIGGDGAAAFARLVQVARQRPDATVVEQQPGYLRLELRTRLFVDDAEFLLDTGRSVIQVRSASRIGYSDLGKNRARVEEIRAAFMAKGGRP